MAKELSRICKKIALTYFEKSNPDNKKLYELLSEIGRKGANIIAIARTFPVPLTINNPTKENPHLLKHMHCFVDYEELILSKEWSTVVTEYHKRGEAFTKKERGLKNAADRLSHHLKPLNNDLYYSDMNGSMYAHDLNRKIMIAQEEIKDLIECYLKFFASELSIYDNYGYNKKRHLKTDLKKITEKSSMWNNKIVALVNELLSIGYTKRRAYIKTYKFLHYIYPHIFQDSDEIGGATRIGQRYNYHTRYYAASGIKPSRMAPDPKDALIASVILGRDQGTGNIVYADVLEKIKTLKKQIAQARQKRKALRAKVKVKSNR
ncbi:MAG: hypothetical protein ACLP9S_13815 [Syntrophales bacterium]